MELRHVLDAVAFTARAHHGHFRKDRQTPYASHVFRVCLIVRDLFGFDDPRMLMAALLHDTIEDTTTDYDDLAERYTPEIARWVALLTKDKRLEEPEREQAYLRELRSAPWQVKACKLADVYDNLLDVAHLPEERRPKTLARTRQYLEGLQQGASPELRRPLELTWALWRQASQ
jgi:guanosine-3',5'-bis(diphosphate) 3'-pyrophosphohydrolase